MKLDFSNFFSFLKSAYSEDGNGSSSRLLTTFLAIVSAVVLVLITLHLLKLTDVALLTIWLASLPLIISALVLFFTAPYGVNKTSGSITDILALFKKDKP